jgi:NTP pyrophosphatase (non-canonical NTP hydrolase)
MTTSTMLYEQLPALELRIRGELRQAMLKHPTWPTDPLHALGVLQEEVGELSKAVLQHTYEPHKKVTRDDIHAEAIQCAAMCLRFLLSLHRYDFTPSAQHRQE